MIYIFLILATPAFAFLGLGPFTNIPGEVLDAPAFESVTDIVVISGTTKYPWAQEKLLNELEAQWKDDGCWDITGHEEARAKFHHGLAPAPSLKKWGAGTALERMVFQRIPERNPKTGVLIFWVLGWEGEKYIPPDPLTVNVQISFGKSRRRGGSDGLPSETPPYSRKAVAQLFDSKTGKELWRAYKSMGRGLPDPEADSKESREEQKQLEFMEFTEFFRPALTIPENMKNSCSPLKRPAAYQAPAVKQEASRADEAIKKLRSGDGEERAAAAKALGEGGGDAAVDALVGALKDENPKVRGTAAKALGDIKDKRAVQPLVALLGDKSKFVRALGAQALGLIGDGRARNPLKKLENDKEELVRKEAGIALKKLWVDPSDLEMDLDMDVNTEGFNLKDDFFKAEEQKANN